MSFSWKKNGLDALAAVGRSGCFLLCVVLRKPVLPRDLGLLIQQIYSVGVLSLPIILLSGLFIGMVLGLQGYDTLSRFGADAQLGQLVALGVVRELGPVVSALLFAGRAGSSLTAEIALMQATEQISSMEMMAVDPLGWVVWPRLFAGLIAMPVLSVIFSAMAIYGGYVVGVLGLGLDAGLFWSNMHAAVDVHADVFNGVFKSVVFGFFMTWISVYQGYHSIPTSEGMAKASTRTVVYASLMVFVLDFIVTALMVVK